MNAFWILTILLSLAVVLLVLWPLWRAPHRDEQTLLMLNRRVYQERLDELSRDQGDGRIDSATFDDLKTELQRNLLTLEVPAEARDRAGTWRLPVVLAMFATAGAMMFYAGTQYSPDIASWWQLKKRIAPTAERVIAGQLPTEAEQNAFSLAQIIQGLQVQLQKNPVQPDGWYTLGVAYAQAEALPQALVAFERAWRLKPDDTRYALTFAQARLFSNQGRLDEMSRDLLQAVVQREPEHEGALLLLGLGAYRSGDPALAVPVLEQLQTVRERRLPNDTSAAMQEVRRALSDARQQLQASADGSVAVRKQPVLRVTVQIDKALAGKFSPDDTLYVFARALQGPPMPLAVIKKMAGELPVTVELDDSQSMMPTRLLSSVSEIVVEARVSRHGSPEKRSGDLEAVAVPVRQGQQGQTVALRINSLVP